MIVVAGAAAAVLILVVVGGQASAPGTARTYASTFLARRPDPGGDERRLPPPPGSSAGPARVDRSEPSRSPRGGVDVLRRRRWARHSLSLASFAITASAVHVIGYPYYTNLLQSRSKTDSIAIGQPRTEAGLPRRGDPGRRRPHADPDPVHQGRRSRRRRHDRHGTASGCRPLPEQRWKRQNVGGGTRRPDFAHHHRGRARKRTGPGRGRPCALRGRGRAGWPIVHDVTEPEGGRAVLVPLAIVLLV